VSDVTRLLDAAAAGDPKAAAELLPLVYDELRKLAAIQLAGEKPGQTLQATALVHEAYIRMVGPADTPKWDSGGHFFAAAARAMRNVLVDAARRKKSEKRGGGRDRVNLEVADFAAPVDSDRWLLLDDALSRLAQEDAATARVAEIRLFAGLSLDDAAKALGISRSTAFRHWTYARAWLQAELQDGDTKE